jgi:outer membrane receptor protein involved in Fe transport
VYITGEHYLTRFNDNTSDNMLLFDTGVKWAVSSMIDVSLSATNLMDEHYYSYSNYGTLSETMYRYHIRPRNILASVQMRF